VQAKEEALRLKDETEQELSKRQRRMAQREERLQKRQEALDKRLDSIERRERNLNKRQSTLDRRSNELATIEEKRVAELERVSGMTQDEARTEILKTVEESARVDMARVLREVEAETAKRVKSLPWLFNVSPLIRWQKRRFLLCRYPAMI